MIPVKISVENPDEQLAALGAGALVSLESSATGGGTGYTVLTTIPIVAATYSYTYYDLTNPTGYWYRTRYTKSDATKPSDYGNEFQSSDTVRSLCSIYEVKQALGIAQTDTGSDEELLRYINEVATIIRRKTSQDFIQDPLSGTTTRLYDGRSSIEGNRLYIQGGIQSLSLLEVAIFTSGSFYTLPASVYFLRPFPYDNRPGWPYLWIQMTDYTLISTTAPVFYFGMSNVRVTGVFGWPSIPEDISAVARKAVINAWRMKSSGGTGDSFTLGVEGQRDFYRYFDADSRATLRAYSTEPLVIA